MGAPWAVGVGEKQRTDACSAAAVVMLVITVTFEKTANGALLS